MSLEVIFSLEKTVLRFWANPSQFSTHYNASSSFVPLPVQSIRRRRRYATSFHPP